MFRIEDEAMGFADVMEGLVAAGVVGVDDVVEVREVSVQ